MSQKDKLLLENMLLKQAMGLTTDRTSEQQLENDFIMQMAQALNGEEDISGEMPEMPRPQPDAPAADPLEGGGELQDDIEQSLES